MKAFKSALLSLSICSSLAIADDWTGTDKTKHFAAGAVVGFAGMAVQANDNPDRYRNSVLAGAAVGLAKELRDSACNCGTASVKDFIMTTVGAAAGAGMGVFLFPEKNGVSVNLVKAF